MPHPRPWWKEATIYQVYPSSFQDSNGDGIGDIPGLISRLPYLHSLGIDAIWLSPHYASPQVDVGYDISDYESVHQPYGTLDDCQHLISACHALGLKILFDLVINHTSDQHSWFREARKSKASMKRDWYFWRPPKAWRPDERSGELVPIPPNNWRSQFSVPAWTFDELTQEFYLHVYAPEMPDLNWELEEVRSAVYKTSMEFWLERGVDGFRIDTVNKYSKDVRFLDAEVVDEGMETQPAMMYYSNGPRMHEFLGEMRGVFRRYGAWGGGEVVTIGELPNTPDPEEIARYVARERRELDMVFNFDCIQLGQTKGDRLVYRPFTTGDFKREVSRWQEWVSMVEYADCWTTAFLENHDQGRCISRFGDDSSEEMRVRSGKMLALILTTMTGTLFLYQGQEIGMTNMPRTWGAEEYKDIRSVNFIDGLKSSGASPKRLGEALHGMQKVARDHARTPMQWDRDLLTSAGFTSAGVTPWMRVNESCKEINVQSQEGDPDSMLAWWREVIQLRRKWKDLFVYGKFARLDVDNEHGSLFMFLKHNDDEYGSGTDLKDINGSWSVTIANLSKERHDFSRHNLIFEKLGSLLAGNVKEPDNSWLNPWEARVYMRNEDATL